MRAHGIGAGARPPNAALLLLPQCAPCTGPMAHSHGTVPLPRLMWVRAFPCNSFHGLRPCCASARRAAPLIPRGCSVVEHYGRHCVPGCSAVLRRAVSSCAVLQGLRCAVLCCSPTQRSCKALGQVTLRISPMVQKGKFCRGTDGRVEGSGARCA